MGTTQAFFWEKNCFIEKLQRYNFPQNFPTKASQHWNGIMMTVREETEFPTILVDFTFPMKIPRMKFSQWLAVAFHENLAHTHLPSHVSLTTTTMSKEN